MITTHNLAWTQTTRDSGIQSSLALPLPILQENKPTRIRGEGACQTTRQEAKSLQGVPPGRASGFGWHGFEVFHCHPRYCLGWWKFISSGSWATLKLILLNQTQGHNQMTHPAFSLLIFRPFFAVTWHRPKLGLDLVLGERLGDIADKEARFRLANVYFQGPVVSQIVRIELPWRWLEKLGFTNLLQII